jgi:magnesium transporter
VDKVTLEVYSYNETQIETKKTFNWQDIKSVCNDERVNWINVAGLSNEAIIDEVGRSFDLNSLLLEDILAVDQRPKAEDFGDHIFFTIKMFHDRTSNGIEFEHVSFVLGENHVLSFQEVEGDIFNLLRERLVNSFGKIRQKKADYLFYRFIDTIVDNYFLVLDSLAEKLEELEEEVMDRPNNHTLQKLQRVRKEIIYLRRSIYPLRESINFLLKSETKLISRETERFLTDVYDHTIQVIESLETYRDLHSSIMDLYMNMASNKMNEIMKVLTIMSTIFIPITFIAGIYGMNFQNMPELAYDWAYPAVWLLMLLVVIGMLFFFRYKKWL